ncbi:hypothetical protein HF265_00430 [Rhizobium leguminosarum]|uniref:hypothetical protein n=1 Tax=Rhizobium leguminosarum TaxID=384 RepID=UPI001C91FC30|nr:hypothetical protein [Rhizobium leguminosarum]MBY3027587.1 hypothetical protein [Rhizobium leguminosarum]
MLPTVPAYHRDGDVADLPEIDAKAAASNHPDEWSLEPWSAGQRRAYDLQKAEERQAASAAVKERAADQVNGKLLIRSPA